MQVPAQAHALEARATLLLSMAVPCLLPVPGVGTVPELDGGACGCGVQVRAIISGSRRRLRLAKR